jgi:hypothetical protein
VRVAGSNPVVRSKMAFEVSTRLPLQADA